MNSMTKDRHSDGCNHSGRSVIQRKSMILIGTFEVGRAKGSAGEMPSPRKWRFIAIVGGSGLCAPASRTIPRFLRCAGETGYDSSAIVGPSPLKSRIEIPQAVLVRQLQGESVLLNLESESY